MERIDIQLVKRKIAKSRQTAKEYILNGDIYLNGKVVKKPSLLINEADEIIFKGEKIKYVSRGGLKLESALKKFNINCNDMICMDIGASTGGFTDCLIQNGAKKVYAIDVGTSQLDKSLKDNAAIISMENTDIRKITSNIIPDKIDLITIDVSFISITKILDNAINFIEENGMIVALIKPQFEVGIKNIAKKGIVKDIKVHQKLLMDMANYFNLVGLSVYDIIKSPIKGGSGNVEYLVYLKKEENIRKSTFDYNSIVNEPIEE
jgi:23S rRNA (cytidine1920-2'-O)/16S rRNA (cytidine1409-2'-O)-methyltransferase